MITKVYFVLRSTEFYNLKGFHKFTNIPDKQDEYYLVGPKYGSTIKYSHKKNRAKISKNINLPLNYSIVSADNLSEALVDVVKYKYIAKVDLPVLDDDFRMIDIDFYDNNDDLYGHKIFKAVSKATIHKCKPLDSTETWIFLKNNGVNLLSNNIHKWIISFNKFNIFEYLLEKNMYNNMTDLFNIILETYVPFANINVDFDEFKKQFVDILISKGLDINQAFCILCSKHQYCIGDMKAVKYFIDNGADIHTHNEYALKITCKKNYFDLFNFLVERGANIYVDNNSPIKIACKEGNVRIVKYLQKMNVNIDNNSLLKIAISKNNYHLVSYLLEKNDNVLTEYRSLISWALEYDHPDIFFILKNKGIDSHTDNKHILCWACEKKYEELALILINDGADLHYENDIIFRLAVKNNCTKIVDKLLLDNNTNIHADNDYAIRIACRNGNYHLVSEFLEKGAHYQVNDNYPLKIAIVNNYFDIVEKLIIQRPKINYQDLLILAKNDKMKSILISAMLE